MPRPPLEHGSRASGAYAWRGIGLDLARTYFPPATIRRFIDVAAHYRLNVVHLHLTDNEAWRLPSRRYPRLPSAQHYTRAQLREFAAYARKRGIVLVPEIDLPAHAAAAIRAYPNLSCGSADTLCPHAAAPFARDVIDEAMELFSGPYVHTGGDEVSGWSPRQRAEFERALDTRIRSAHRTMVVWDDEVDAAPADAIVEVWHLGDAAKRAQRLGHRVVAASDGPLYFDAVQGAAQQEPPGTRYMSTLEEVYAFSPPPKAMGVEGIIWSEHIANELQLWYALLPREAALGAVANAGSEKMPWPLFRDSVLPGEFSWLLANGYAFRVPNTLMAIREPATFASVAGDPDSAVAFVRVARVRVLLRSLVPGARILYRIAGQPLWRRYTGPVSLDAGTRIEAKTQAPDTREGPVTTLYLRSSSDTTGSRHFDDVVSP
ncbi:MAG TPA: family 20 glycosylhydrolase [Candidatus Baltobacteraceae bacterium]|nr:family 20 glycosylhydrolase [Candidatus Baltobacteraceae bacterium]